MFLVHFKPNPEDEGALVGTGSEVLTGGVLELAVVEFLVENLLEEPQAEIAKRTDKAAMLTTKDLVNFIGTDIDSPHCGERKN
jgi:hypothetical protein